MNNGGHSTVSLISSFRIRHPADSIPVLYGQHETAQFYSLISSYGFIAPRVKTTEDQAAEDKNANLDGLAKTQNLPNRLK
jgi:hypothetical protein